jgi:probable F420-dependent oxidoreductase
VKPAALPPRVLAALGPRMLALADERASGAHPYLVTPEHTAKARVALGPDRWLLPEQAVVLETNRDQARTIARRHISRYLDLPNYTNNWRRLGFTDDDLVGQGSDRLVDALVAWVTWRRLARV